VNYLYYLLAVLSLGIIVGFMLYRKKEHHKNIAYKALIEKVSELEAKSNSVEEPKNTATKKTVSITDEKAQAILKGLQKFEAQEQFLDENYNLRLNKANISKLDTAQVNNVLGGVFETKEGEDTCTSSSFTVDIEGNKSTDTNY
jgi:hypothetical protein